jgi:heterotetrameric sarcosine oxidase delta subunit
MRLNCPYCGERDVQEFATWAMPPCSAAGDSLEAFHDYVFLRDNPAGLHREYWHHAHGCRSWLVVTRDTRTHEVTGGRLRQAGQP